MFNFIKKKVIENRENETILFEHVLNELNENVIVKGLWAKAMAYGEGNHEKVKALYMQYRVQSIKDHLTKLTIAYDEISDEVLKKLSSEVFNEEIVSSVKVKKEKALDSFLERNHLTLLKRITENKVLAHSTVTYVDVYVEYEDSSSSWAIGFNRISKLKW